MGRPNRGARRQRDLHSAFVEMLLEQGYETIKIGTVAQRASHLILSFP